MKPPTAGLRRCKADNTKKERKKMKAQSELQEIAKKFLDPTISGEEICDVLTNKGYTESSAKVISELYGGKYKLANTEKYKKDRKDAVLRLLGLGLTPGFGVLYKVKSVSRNGMSRDITFFVLLNNQMFNITDSIADLTGHELNYKSWTVKIRGCGFNVPQWAISQASKQIFESTTAEEIDGSNALRAISF